MRTHMVLYRVLPAIFLSYLACNPSTDISEVHPPNIILVMTDDQGYGDLGITGNPILETPHIDAMAGRSASLERFYVSPVCSPTRACLMTGRYNYRTRVVDTWIGRSMMEPEEVTIAEVLGEAGYATGIFGKWHLGDCYPMRPQDQGFAESLVHKGGGLAQPSEPFENERRYTDPYLFHNGTQVKTEGYCTDVYFDAALNFMTEQHQQGQPFFAYIPTNAPHGPFHDVPADLREKYAEMDLSAVFGNQEFNDRQKEIAINVFAMVENIDQNMGKLFARLEELGITHNTLVIFMIDNGPVGGRYNGGLRSGKTDVYEGGIRSPFFAQWPDRLKAGTQSNRIAAHIDLLPTLAEAAGVSLSDNQKVDGKSILPLLEGKDKNWPDRQLFIQSHRGDRPVRYHHFAAITQDWKLLRSSGFGRDTLPDDVKPFELYNVSSDPGEKTDVSSNNPQKVQELTRAYETWFDDVSQTRPHNYDPPRIVIGTDHEEVTVLTPQDWRNTEGAVWGKEGSWLLTVAQPATFEIRVQTRLPEESIHLKIGDKILGNPSMREENISVFSSVQLEAGDIELKTIRNQNKGWQNTLHVSMHRQ